MKLKSTVLAAAAASLLAPGAASALTFQLSFIPGTTAVEQASFQAAANLWSQYLTDNVTVKLTVGTASLGSGILAQAGSRRIDTTYSQFKTALTADASTALDATAVANLGPGSSFGAMLNYTSDNPNGPGSATPWVDNDGSANNSTVRLTAANARALGVAFGIGGVGSACSDCDAFIRFGTAWNWDHDRSDGIDADSFDFVGVAAHEIGHALGFVSGVDTLDANSNGGFASNQFTFVSSLDLFRWSVLSKASDVIDWSADPRDKHFSIDRGATLGPRFSTGTTRGDGRQASHWKDNLFLGVMDPTAARGELLVIRQNDLNAFDAIGWDALPIPEPGTWALMALGLAGVGAATRRRTTNR
jgi:hypothetical protein